MITENDFQETKKKGIYSLIKTDITEREKNKIIKSSKNFAGLREKEYSMKVVKEIEEEIDRIENKLKNGSKDYQDGFLLNYLKKFVGDK